MQPSGAPPAMYMSAPQQQLQQQQPQQQQQQQQQAPPPGRASELIPGKLFFVLVAAHPQDTQRSHYFNIDTMLLYDPFFDDFGPLHLGKVKRFSNLVDDKLRSPDNQHRTLYFYSMFHDKKAAANASCLVALYAMFRLGTSPQAALTTISNWSHCWAPFVDAGPPEGNLPPYQPFFLALHDVVFGAYKASALHKWFDIASFDADQYEHFEQIANGDWNWVIPGQILAFSGPCGPHTLFSIPQYTALFRSLGVTTVVRLNEAAYDAAHFTAAGFEHHDLFYPDGSNPPPAIVEAFLSLLPSPHEPAAAAAAAGTPRRCLAIHCKAGLGRTGTLIALHMMRSHGFTAREAIGWLRLCRPGSVLGPQQQYLCDMEQAMAASSAGAERGRSAAPHGGRGAAQRGASSTRLQQGGGPPAAAAVRHRSPSVGTRPPRSHSSGRGGVVPPGARGRSLSQPGHGRRGSQQQQQPQPPPLLHHDAPAPYAYPQAQHHTAAAAAVPLPAVAAAQATAVPAQAPFGHHGGPEPARGGAAQHSGVPAWMLNGVTSPRSGSKRPAAGMAQPHPQAASEKENLFGQGGGQWHPGAQPPALAAAAPSAAPTTAPGGWAGGGFRPQYYDGAPIADPRAAAAPVAAAPAPAAPGAGSGGGAPAGYLPQQPAGYRSEFLPLLR